MNENTLISRYFAPLVRLEGAWGLRDDAATLAVPQGFELVITTDTLIENVHFYADDPPKTIAQKALRVNLSDLAAKGATPYAYTLNFAAPTTTTESWIAAFCEGLCEDSEAFNCSLIGGDSVKAPLFAFTITAFGLIETGKIVRRTGANEGDLILVSGTIGDAALGLTQKTGHYRERYLLPQPRVALVDYVKTYASASMDISDGLIGDLQKLLAASQKGGEITLEKVPLHTSLMGADFITALTGGDDYELLLTVPENHYQPHPLLTIIGKVTKDEGLISRLEGKEMIFPSPSFQHF